MKVNGKKNWLYAFEALAEESDIGKLYSNWDQLFGDSCRKYEAIIFIYDVREQDSFEYIKKKKEILLSNVDVQNKVLVLLANKIDLKKDRIFKEEDSRKFAEDSNMKYFEISVRNDDSKIIKHLVEEVAKEKGRKNEKEEEDL